MQSILHVFSYWRDKYDSSPHALKRKWPTKEKILDIWPVIAAILRLIEFFPFSDKVNEYLWLNHYSRYKKNIEFPKLDNPFSDPTNDTSVVEDLFE